MSKREYFLRYSLILKRLMRGPATFDEIDAFLDREANLLDVDLTISKRTFQRDLSEIKDIFGADIQFDFSRRVYTLVQKGITQVSERMLESFGMFNALNVSENLSNIVFFERKAHGSTNFYGIIHCIKHNLILRFPYLKFDEGVVSNREVEPYALKEFKGRWYLFGKETNGNELKTFGLDRILEIEVTKKKFIYPSDFNINEHFRNYYGIINTSDYDFEDVVLSFDSFQGKYIQSNPLHESQVVLVDNEKELRIKLSVYITYDLILEIMSYGDRVTVIEPIALKETIVNMHKRAIDLHSADIKCQ